MDDIARSVMHLSNHIISTLSRSSLQDFNVCSTSEGGTPGTCEGTLGIINHTKFLQHLSGEPKNLKNGDQSSRPWLLARFRPPVAPKHEKMSIISSDGSVPEVEDERKFWTIGAKSESRLSEQDRLLSQGSPLVVRSDASNWSETIVESPLNTEGSYGGAVSKEDLGRATWTFLHTLAAQFPVNPTKQQQRDAKDLMIILSRIYPCKECADHFKDVLKAHPVECKSGDQLAQWMCRVHNMVNRSLGKAQFPCHRVNLRWGAVDCNEGACDLHGKLYGNGVIDLNYDFTLPNKIKKTEIHQL